MSVARVFLVVLAALAVSACDLSGVLERVIPDDARETVDRARNAILDADRDALEAITPPETSPAVLDNAIAQITSMLPSGETPDVSLSGAHISTSQVIGEDSVQTLDLVYLAAYESGNRRLELRIQKTGESPWHLTWYNLLEAGNHSGLSLDWGSNASKQNIALAASLGSFSLILLTLFASFRFKRVKRRILWSILILAAYPVFAFNWTDQTWTLIAPAITSTETTTHFNLVSLTFFGAGFADFSPLEAAELRFAVPFGALLFWYRVLRGGPTRKPLPADAAG